MFACGQCGGVWVEKKSAKVIQEKLPEEAIRLATLASQYGRGASTTALVACPICQQTTRRFQAANGIELDECDQHGTWFDRGELEIIATALRAMRQATAHPTTAPRSAAPPSSAPVAPPPGYAGYRGPSRAAIAAGAVGAVGVAAGAAVLAQQQQQASTWNQIATSDAIEIGADVVDTALDVIDVGSDVMDSGVIEAAADGLSTVGNVVSSLADSGAAETISEGAGTILEGLFTLLGFLSD